MSEFPTEPLDERIKKSPIHKWTDVEGFLDRSLVPGSVRPLIHELLIARGHYSWNISQAEAAKLLPEVETIVQRYPIPPAFQDPVNRTVNALIINRVRSREMEQ